MAKVANVIKAAMTRLRNIHSLPQSSSCPVAHQASTRERHCCRSAARLMVVPHVRPHSFISFTTVRLHVSLGQQRLLSPPAVQRKAVLGSRSGDIRHTCPSHLHLRLLICMAREIASVLWCSSSLVMMLSQNTPRIFRRDLFWKVSSFCASLPISFQHSCTISVLFSISIAWIWLALPILAMASFAESPSVVILLPRYAKS